MIWPRFLFCLFVVLMGIVLILVSLGGWFWVFVQLLNNPSLICGTLVLSIPISVAIAFGGYMVYLGTATYAIVKTEVDEGG